jgi:NAD(P)-dependent dehydrogenase (short-subunit alcohol dehydrogenase family)
MQFATNHLGHFALALGLHDVLAAAGDARIVSLSSVGHRRSPVIFDDIHFASRAYDPPRGSGPPAPAYSSDRNLSASPCRTFYISSIISYDVG